MIIYNAKHDVKFGYAEDRNAKCPTITGSLFDICMRLRQEEYTGVVFYDGQKIGSFYDFMKKQWEYPDFKNLYNEVCSSDNIEIRLRDKQ